MHSNLCGPGEETGQKTPFSQAYPVQDWGSEREHHEAGQHLCGRPKQMERVWMEWTDC